MLSATIKVNALKRQTRRQSESQTERQTVGLLDSLILCFCSCFSLRAEDESDFHNTDKKAQVSQALRKSIPYHTKLNWTQTNWTELRLSRAELSQVELGLNWSQSIMKNAFHIYCRLVLCSAVCSVVIVLYFALCIRLGALYLFNLLTQS